jgi:Fe-S cluster assembly ATP-binding protein
MNKLTIENLHASINGEQILKGINLEFEKGKVHVLMGPNGSGKSTLANVLMGNPKYQIDSGKIILDGEDITEISPTERAKKGLFLSFQYPSEITGVTMSNFLRTAWNSVKEEKLNVIDFHKKLKEKMEKLGIDKTFTRRYINEGFSGGEKKRAEILQLLTLEPKYAILDETDSGLDVNSIEIVGEAVNGIRDEERGIMVITHYYRILNHITPDVASIMIDGKIVKTGGKELAEEIEKNGFTSFTNQGDSNGI